MPGGKPFVEKLKHVAKDAKAVVGFVCIVGLRAGRQAEPDDSGSHRQGHHRQAHHQGAGLPADCRSDDGHGHLRRHLRFDRIPKLDRQGRPKMFYSLPVSARQAMAMGLLDDCFGKSPAEFLTQVQARARALAASDDLPALLRTKARRRAQDEATRPLADCRQQELQRMHRNFYGFDPSYHIARSNFVHRVAPYWTPRHLALHR